MTCIVCTVLNTYVAPSDPVQNVMIYVIDNDNIAVFILWKPPTDPNGVITFYRVQFEEISDPLNNGNNVRRKRNNPLHRNVMNIYSNITGGNFGAPTNVTLSGLS